MVKHSEPELSLVGLPELLRLSKPHFLKDNQAGCRVRSKCLHLESKLPCRRGEMRFPMIAEVMKLLAAVGALLVAALPKPGAAYQVALECVVCLCSVMVVREAALARKYFWLIAFGAIAVLFNPVVPVVPSHKVSIWLDLVCVLMFLASLAVLHARPAFSIPSITDRTPGSVSL